MSTHSVKPLGNRVLVKRSIAKTSKGGIILPDTAQEKPKLGEVVAVGPGKIDEHGTLQPLHVIVGDKVVFGAYAGTEVKNGLGEDKEAEYLIIAEDEILGIVV